MSRAVRSLTVGNHFLFGSDLACRIHFCQFAGGFEKAFRIEIVRPFQVNGTRNGAAALRAHELSGVFGIASRIDDHGRRIVELLQDIIGGRKAGGAPVHFEIAAPGNRGLLCDRESGIPPRIETAV